MGQGPSTPSAHEAAQSYSVTTKDDCTSMQQHFHTSNFRTAELVHINKIQKYLRGTEADTENPVLKAEQEAHAGTGNKGCATIIFGWIGC